MDSGKTWAWHSELGIPYRLGNCLRDQAEERIIPQRDRHSDAFAAGFLQIIQGGACEQNAKLISHRGRYRLSKPSRKLDLDCSN